MLNVTDLCVISPVTGKGAFLPCGTLYILFFIPNWNCHYWVSQQTELTQSKTPPTAITDSIILSKGTWSINGYVSLNGVYSFQGPESLENPIS